MFNKLTKFLIFILVVLSAVIPVSAGQTRQVPDLPEQAGIYAVPDRPDLKLRVFVYQVKKDPSAPPLIMPTEVCTLSDPDSSAIVAGAGWKLPSTWTYRLNLSSVPASIGSAHLSAIVDNSFSQWQKAVGHTVNIARGADTKVIKAQYDGQNIITWGRTSGSALAVSYIWYNNKGFAVEVDTIMNNKFNWYWSDPSTWSGSVCAYNGVYDAQNILTHELGHSYGLNDHYTSAYQDNTMYGYGAKTETKKDTLTSGDIAGVRALY